MQVFVKFELFQTITERDEILEVRERVGQQLQKIQASGKVKAGNIFADARGGFFLLDVQSSQEVSDLLGSPFLDHFQIETHPVITFEQLGEFFRKDRAAVPVHA